jgi:limonene-1,2-epoxide hydrolase
MANTEEFMREFVASFETKDVSRVGAFFHEDILFAKYGDPEVWGKANVVKFWEGFFSTFETVRFETIHQAINGPIVLAEQFHHLALKGCESAPVRNMARYKMRDGLIGVWRDVTDSRYADQLLEATKPISFAARGDFDFGRNQAVASLAVGKSNPAHGGWSAG